MGSGRVWRGSKGISAEGRDGHDQTIVVVGGGKSGIDERDVYFLWITVFSLGFRLQVAWVLA